MPRTITTLIACAGIMAVAVVAFAQADPRSNPFLAPQFLPPGIEEIEDLPRATGEIFQFSEIRCHLVDHFTTRAQFRDDLAYFERPNGEPPASIASAVTTALRETHATLDDYRRGANTLAIANAIRPKWGAIRTVTDLGFDAWERCGHPKITDPATRPCVYSSGRELLAAMPPTRVAEFRRAKKTLFAQPYGTVSWFGTTYCTSISDAYQMNWTDLPPPNPAIMFLLEHPEQFCEIISELTKEGMCTLLIEGKFLEAPVRSVADRACRSITGGAHGLGFTSGWRIGERVDRDLLDPNLNPGAQHGRATIGLAHLLGDIAFRGTRFVCGEVLKEGCKWIFAEVARKQTVRCVADLVELQKDIEHDVREMFGRSPPHPPRTVERLEEILRQRGATLDD